MKKCSKDLFRTYVKMFVEAAYSDNQGFEEMMKFYRVASSAEEQEMDDVVARGDYEAYAALIARVLKVKLNPILVARHGNA